MNLAKKLCRLILCACLVYLAWPPETKASYPACPTPPDFQAIVDYQDRCAMYYGVTWLTYHGKCDMSGQTYEHYSCHCGTRYGDQDRYFTQPCGYPSS